MNEHFDNDDEAICEGCGNQNMDCTCLSQFVEIECCMQALGKPKGDCATCAANPERLED